MTMRPMDTAQGSRPAGGRPLEVTVVLLGDGPPSTAVVPVEIFSCAGVLWNVLNGHAAAPGFRVTIASLDGKPVMSGAGLLLGPQTSISDIAHSDIVIVPTSGLELDEHVVLNGALAPWLRRMYDQGAYLAGVCMGAAYIAEAGLLDGRMGTTHWALTTEFVRRYPKVDWRTDLFVTEDSRVLCSGGVYASIDLSLYLVEKFCGHEMAVQCAKALLLPRPRLQQSGYAVTPLSGPHDDDRIRKVEAYIHSHFSEDVCTDGLASQAGLGIRTFVRHFKAATGRHPIAYLQAVRIEAAKAMLERDAGSVQTISSAVGYDDVAFFRGLFKRSTGMTPAEYRAHFGPMSMAGNAELA
jgi:transcriptional regulator GlxA family with amidase domain